MHKAICIAIFTGVLFLGSGCYFAASGTGLEVHLGQGAYRNCVDTEDSLGTKTRVCREIQGGAISEKGGASFEALIGLIAGILVTGL